MKKVIVLIDESLSGLDGNTRVKAIDMIMQECRDKTLVVITHDTEMITELESQEEDDDESDTI